MRNQQQTVRKAAILIASLDRQTAEALLAQMPAEQADAVRVAIDDLNQVSAEEQQATIEEFFRIGPLLPEKAPPGIELDGEATDEWLPSVTVRDLDQSLPGGPAPGESWFGPAAEVRPVQEAPFRFLAETSSDALARYLQREHPQTVAVVLSHLTSDRAAEVLALLPERVQGEVTLRLVHLDKTHPDVLADIERGMHSWMLEQSQDLRRRTAGLATLRDILAASTDRAKQNILDSLAQRDRRLAQKLAIAPRRSLAFADLARLDDVTLERVLRQASEEVVLLALLGAAEPLLHRVLEMRPADEAEQMRRQLEHFGPIRLSDVEQAQHELARLATQTVTAGAGALDDGKRLSVAA